MKTLDNRIEAVRAEINAFIDSHAEQLKKSCPAVPLGVLRKTLVGTTGECECRQYLKINAEIAKDVVA